MKRPFIFSKHLILAAGLIAQSNLYADQKAQEVADNSSFFAARTNPQQVNKSDRKTINPLMEILDADVHPGYYVTGDFIYWRAQEDGLEYALSGLLYDSSVTTSLPFKGKAFSPDFEWDPGFKLGAGYTDSCYLWDLFVNWTWFRSDADGSAQDGASNTFSDEELYAQYTIPRLGLPQIAAAKANWNLHYNTLDFSIGRSFSIGEHFTFKPFGGLRGAWIHQNYTLQNIGFGPSNFETVQNKLNFRGVGFRGGTSSIWRFFKNFSFFGDTSVSLLYSNIEDTYKEIRSASFNNSNDQTVANLNNTTNTMKAEIEFSLGFQYKTLYNKDKYLFSFDVAWEYLNWINFNQFYVPATGTDPYPLSGTQPYQFNGQFERSLGDLGLMGLRVGAQFGF